MRLETVLFARNAGRIDYTDLSIFQVPCCVFIILFILFDLMLLVCSEKQHTVWTEHISMGDLGWAGQEGRGNMCKFQGNIFQGYIHGNAFTDQ